MKRVLTGRFMHETNTFSVQKTDMALWRRRDFHRDNEIPAAFRGTRSALGATFEVADAQSLPLESARFGAAVSGLVLNFVPKPLLAGLEMARAVRPGGVVAAYVWDYAGKMELMRHFWDAAVALDPAAVEADEGSRFPSVSPMR